MDIIIVRENPSFVKENQIKRYLDPNIVDIILNNDNQWRRSQFLSSQIKKYKNTIGKYMKDAKNGDVNIMIVDELFNEIRTLIENNNITITAEFLERLQSLTRNELRALSKLCSAYEENNDLDTVNYKTTRDHNINILGNLLHNSVIISDDEVNNDVVFNKVNYYPIDVKLNHVELCEKLKIIDLKGINISGNRGYFLCGFGVKLNYALIQYGIDFLTERGYQMMYTPHMMNNDILSKVCQLNEYSETLYKIDNDDKYLIATSEQPLTGYFVDTTVDNLPIKFGGISSCYRKEAGSHGKDTSGIFRVHQFEKVEQFVVTDHTKSWEMMENMINVCKEFYNSLGFNYRIVSIVSGALNNAASKKYDLEGYFPASKQFRELVSCTNTLDYMSKRINCKDNKGNYVHMLNSTLFANTRTICCFLETHQTEKGITIPHVLQKYMGCDHVDFLFNMQYFI